MCQYKISAIYYDFRACTLKSANQNPMYAEYIVRIWLFFICEFKKSCSKFYDGKTRNHSCILNGRLNCHCPNHIKILTVHYTVINLYTIIFSIIWKGHVIPFPTLLLSHVIWLKSVNVGGVEHVAIIGHTRYHSNAILLEYQSNSHYISYSPSLSLF